MIILNEGQLFNGGLLECLLRLCCVFLGSSAVLVVSRTNPVSAIFSFIVTAGFSYF